MVKCVIFICKNKTILILFEIDNWMDGEGLYVPGLFFL